MRTALTKTQRQLLSITQECRKHRHIHTARRVNVQYNKIANYVYK